uniref:Uncharacterized protein n=1 Tax=Candidatus Kentrum sp. LPFa TaxID=2126335 RepID=A0A450WE41_9GAMM|nr:MAG: hypothetical protein BECKLPF1236B_GA0070989_107515 [Candidatus Kentron sp. LPFa]
MFSVSILFLFIIISLNTFTPMSGHVAFARDGRRAVEEIEGFVRQG